MAKIIFSIFTVLLLVGCAADPADIKEVAVKESAQLSAPTKPLSGFADYDLRPVTFSKNITVGERRTKHAARLNKVLKAKMDPLFSQWKSEGGEGRTGTLIIEPELTRFRIVGGAARFWTGVFSGQSKVEMTLKLTDSVTNQVIAQPNIDKRSGAWAGAYSLGQSDKNLHDYIAGIVHEYLMSNYTGK